MKAIIIGAGRGSRLQHQTDHLPKTLVHVLGRPMLEQILDALYEAGFSAADVVFVSGYAEDVLRSRHPELNFVRNADWENNNILASLLCAREHMAEGFLATYADIVYEPGVVKRLLAAKEDIVLGCDTEFRQRYVGRSQHPESDAEKLRADGRRVTELSRRIPADEAQGEFIGVMKLSPAGARELIQGFDRAKARYAGQLYREGRSFERAYLIDLLAELLEAGSAMFREDTAGGYMEIDTLQDLELSSSWWQAWNERTSKS